MVLVWGSLLCKETQDLSRGAVTVDGVLQGEVARLENWGQLRLPLSLETKCFSDPAKVCRGGLADL